MELRRLGAGSSSTKHRAEQVLGSIKYYTIVRGQPTRISRISALFLASAACGTAHVQRRAKHLIAARKSRSRATHRPQEKWRNGRLESNAVRVQAFNSERNCSGPRSPNARTVGSRKSGSRIIMRFLLRPLAAQKPRSYFFVGAGGQRRSVGQRRCVCLGKVLRRFYHASGQPF